MVPKLWDLVGLENGTQFVGPGGAKEWYSICGTWRGERMVPNLWDPKWDLKGLENGTQFVGPGAGNE